MQECISTSRKSQTAIGLIGALFLVSLSLSPIYAWAQAPAKDRTLQPEEDDFSSTPYTDYGEFHEQDDEAEDTKFFQHGRFFGLSLGAGYSGVTGNRALLWRGGFPMIDFKVLAWLDFNFAIALGVSSANHYYDALVSTSGGSTTTNQQTHTDIGLVRLGIDLRYYFDVKNLAAPISFANPYVLVGAGSFTKTETETSGATPGARTSDSSFALSAGGGFEFVLKPKKVFFDLEGRVNFLNFQDTHSQAFVNSNPPIGDLTGTFYSFSGAFLFTW